MAETLQQPPPQFLETLERFPKQIKHLQERFARAKPFLSILGHEASALTAGLKQGDRLTQQRSLVVELQDQLQPEVADVPDNDEAVASRLPLILQSQEMLGSAEACLAALQVMVDSCRAVLSAGQQEVATYRTLVAAARHNTACALQFAVARSNRHHNANASPLLQLPADVLKAITARAGPGCRAICWGLRSTHDHATTALALRPDPRPPSSTRNPAAPALYVLRTWPAPHLITSIHSTTGLPLDLTTAVLARLPALRTLTVSAPAVPDPHNPLDSQLWALASASAPPPPRLTALRLLTPARVAWEVLAPWAPSLASLTLAPYGNPSTLSAFTALTALTVTGANTFTGRHVRQDAFWAALPSLPRLHRLAVAADVAWGSALAHAAAPLLTALTHLDTTLRAPQFGPPATAPPLASAHPHAPHGGDNPAADAVPPADAPGPLIVAAAVRRIPALASLHLRGAAALLALPDADLAHIGRQLARLPLTHLRLTGTGHCEAGALRALNLGVIRTLQDLAVTWTDQTCAPVTAATLLPNPHPGLRTLTLHLDGLQLGSTLHHTRRALPGLTHLHFLAGPASCNPPPPAPSCPLAAPSAAHPPLQDAATWAAHTAVGAAHGSSVHPLPHHQQQLAAAAVPATTTPSPAAPAPAPANPQPDSNTGTPAVHLSPTTPLDATPLLQPQPQAPPTSARTSLSNLASIVPESLPPTAPFAYHAPAQSAIPAPPTSHGSTQAQPSALALLAGAHHAVSVDLTRAYATPRDILALAALPALHELRLGRIDFQARLPRCLAAARRLRSLQVLNLAECREPLDAPALQRLAEAFPCLRELVVPDAAAVRTATQVLGQHLDVIRAPQPADPVENC